MKIIAVSALLLVTSNVVNAELRGRQDQRREQSAVGKIKELQWVNADTNQRNFPIDGSSIVPINLEEEFADTINGYELPNATLSMEAMIEPGSGPVGSVKFTFNGVTLIENNAPWALCANRGADFLPCASLREQGGTITAQVFSGKSATGASSDVLLTYIRYSFKAVPEGSIHLVNSDTDIDMGFCGGAVVSLSETPNVGFFLDQWTGRFRWSAQSARFDYDNGTRIVVENTNPLAFPGNNGGDYFGISPGVGEHTVAAQLFSKQFLQGQTVTWKCDFEVVA